jgi:hypothetical protein
MNILDHPPLVFLLFLVGLWVCIQIGSFARRRLKALDEGERSDFDIVLTATLTLLGLLIGFSFSMAVSRYDQRKNLEEEEANAIGTEYARADLLPGPDAAKVRELLKQYLDQRVLFYATRDEQQLEKINADTARLQAALWSAVRTPVTSQPTAVVALAASGMNDVLNSQGYTQAAWWNRIPVAAWGLMAAIAVSCNLLIGYGAHRTGAILSLVLPIALAISFFLVADIDSPRGGIIRVLPRNLVSLSQSLRAE